MGTQVTTWAIVLIEIFIHNSMYFNKVAARSEVPNGTGSATVEMLTCDDVAVMMTVGND